MTQIKKNTIKVLGLGILLFAVTFLSVANNSNSVTTTKALAGGGGGSDSGPTNTVSIQLSM